MIQAAMLIALGFLCASLLALALLPALARRAERLARRRAEAAFPLSLAEIAADRDHLRAEWAVKIRAAEQQAERGFAARAESLQSLGRRDMEIARQQQALSETEHRLALITAELAQTQAELATRTEELARDAAALRDAQASLSERETQLAALRHEHESLRVAQVESRTEILVLQGKRDELAVALAAASEQRAASEAALAEMSARHEAERLRADALAARVEQAEAGLAAADAQASAVSSALLEARRNHQEEIGALKQADTEREARMETLRAELMLLEGALAQARADGEEARQALSSTKRAAAEPADAPALRREIVRLADSLMETVPKQHAAE